MGYEEMEVRHEKYGCGVIIERKGNKVKDKSAGNKSEKNL